MTVSIETTPKIFNTGKSAENQPNGWRNLQLEYELNLPCCKSNMLTQFSAR